MPRLMLQKSKELEQRTGEIRSRASASALKQDCSAALAKSQHTRESQKFLPKGTASVQVFPGTHWTSSSPARAYWLNRSHPQVLSLDTGKEDREKVRSSLYCTFNTVACKDSLYLVPSVHCDSHTALFLFRALIIRVLFVSYLLSIYLHRSCAQILKRDKHAYTPN